MNGESYLQNISGIFVYFSWGGSWKVKSPATGFRPFAGVSRRSNSVNTIVGKLSHQRKILVLLKSTDQMLERTVNIEWELRSGIRNVEDNCYCMSGPGVVLMLRLVVITGTSTILFLLVVAYSSHFLTKLPARKEFNYLIQ